MKKLSTLFSMTLVALFFTACGPNVENEQKAWNDNLQKMNSLKSAYPVFASFIDGKIQDAKQLWTASESIGDKEVKAEKMQEANNVFEKGCLYELSQMKDKMNQLDTKIGEVKSARMGEKGDDKRFANDAVTDAQNTLTSAGKYLSEGKTEITSEPCEVISKAYAMVNASYDNLVSALAKFAEKTTQDTLKTGKTNTNTQQPVDIKCEYCGTTNPAANAKCTSCGAPLKK